MHAQMLPRRGTYLRRMLAALMLRCRACWTSTSTPFSMRKPRPRTTTSSRSCWRCDRHHITSSHHHITSHHITSHRCGQMFMPWTPVVDGKELIGQPIDLIAAGIYNKVQHITYHCLDFSHADAGCARYHWRRGRRGWVFKHPYALTGSDMHDCQAACLSGS